MNSRKAGRYKAINGGETEVAHAASWETAKAVSQMAAQLTIVIGLSVLLGWAFGIEPLKRIVASLVAMNPLTAVALILCGISLRLQSEATQEGNSPSRSPARVLALCVLGLGLIKLGGIFSGIDTGIDRILFSARLDLEPNGLPNRMAPNTAFNLCLISGALLLLDKRLRWCGEPGQALCLLAALPVLLAILGYAYDTATFYIVTTYIPMALHTAITMGILLVGIMFARPQRGLMAQLLAPDMGGLTMRRLLPAAICFPAFLGWFHLMGENAGYFSVSTGSSLFVVSTIVVLTAAIWWTASSLGHLDNNRRSIEAERLALARRLDSVSLLNQQIMDHSLDIICTIDAEGRLRQVSPASEKVWGYTPKELAGRLYMDLVHPEDEAHTIAGAAAVMAGQPVSDFENRYIRKDGTPVPMAWSAAWSEIDQTMYCVARDNTERKEAQEKLRSSGRQLELAQQLAHLGSWEWDISAGKLFWSDELYRILGYEPGEVAPGYDAYLARVHPDDQELVRHTSGVVLKEKGSIDYEYRIVRPDGSMRAIHGRGEIIPDQSGHSIKAIGSVQDITERKFIEEQLQKAKTEAERANMARSEFISRMSHELRTPLNAILGFAQLLEMEDLAPSHRDGLQQILKGGRHLLELVNEVLDIASIDAGRLALSPEPISLADAAGQVLELLLPLAAEQGISLKNDIDPGCYVTADQQRLKQVLLNLLSNAVKYNCKGGSVRVVQAAPCTREGQGRVRFEVIDTGPGISPAGLEKLFAPFERLEAMKRGVEGTGIGLTISQRLVVLMDGEIGVTSIEGEGSTFWVELPAAEDPVQAFETSEANGSNAIKAEDDPAPSSGHTILSIEDNLSNLKLIERILSRRPEIELLAAMQGRLGLELAREHRPDLILLDLHLPDISGDLVLKQLQAAAQTRDIPVIVISADATARQIDHLLDMGAKAYLTKPLDVPEFLRVLNENLQPIGPGETS